MELPSSAVLSKGSYVCVTGANGLVGSYVVDELLTFGLRVRGVVREAVRCAWMQRHFDCCYGEGRFELVEVKDLGAAGSLDKAFDGCEGVVATAGDATLNDRADGIIETSVRLIENLLETASRHASVKRVVYTSSAAAAAQKMNEPYDLNPDMWNEQVVQAAKALPLETPGRGVILYAASKTQAEQVFFRLGHGQGKHFRVASVVPDYVLGPPFDLEEQGFQSSVGLLKRLWDGEKGWEVLPGQFIVDARDCARLHLAALMHPDTSGERVFGFAHFKTWAVWIEVLRRRYPRHRFPDPPEHEDVHLANVTAHGRAEELLQWLTGTTVGFKPMMKSLLETTLAMDYPIKAKA